MFLIIGLIAVIGFFANFIFKKFKIPDLIILLILGIIINLLNIFQDTWLTTILPYFSSLALMFILFEGGTEMKFYSAIKEIPRASILTIILFILSVSGIAVISTSLLNLSIELATLLGVIVGGSSSAIVIPLLQGIDEKIISKDTKSFLSLESALTDALCIVVAIAILETLSLNSNIGLPEIINQIISSFSIAVVFGMIFGLFWIKLLPMLEKYEFHYILTISMVFLIYSITEYFNGTGAISSLIFGIVLGNGKEIGGMFKMKNVKNMTPTTNIFHKQIAFFIRTFFFVILGLIVSIKSIDMFLYGTLLTFILLLVRVIGSRIVIYNYKIEYTDKKIISIMFPRGLAAAVLAPLPYIQYKFANTVFFPDIIFSVIVTSVIITTACIYYITKNK